MAPRPTARTFVRAVRHVENWPEVVSLRLGIGRREMSLLSFRNGISMAVRRQSADWDVVRDLFLQSGYARSFEYLRALTEGGTVIDLGGNIGAFSLLAAAQNERVAVRAYEPGPPNIRMFELNCLFNVALSTRIELRREAAAGTTRMTEWHFDAGNAGGSSLYGNGRGTPVQVRSFAEIVASVQGAIALVKIDIEGAEYELVRSTPAAVWDRVPAFTIEVHGDPEEKASRTDLMKRFHELGYASEPDGQFATLYRRPEPSRR